MNVFREIIRVQWKWAWKPVLLCTLAAFAVPILSVQKTSIDMKGPTGAAIVYSVPEQFLSTMERWGVLYTAISAALGLAVAIYAWSADHRGRHVYALILPIQRWRLVLLRFASGALFLTLPTVALLASSLLAISMTNIPEGLHAYPLELAIRFGLAALVSFSIFFAISAGTARTAAMILAPVALLVLTDVLLSASGMHVNLTENAAAAVFDWPGILEVFTGRWLLVDV